MGGPLHRISAKMSVLAVACATLVTGLPAAASAAPGPAVPTLDWKACAAPLEKFQCATAKVPLDYQRLDKGTTDLAVLRLPATGKREGSLFLNPGGPGGSGVGFVPRMAARYPDSIKAKYDLISFDPRGVGQSGQLKCWNTDRFVDEVDTSKSNPTHADLGRLLINSRDFDEDCVEYSGKLVDHVSTANVARDMDLLRQAVGDKQLSYHGYSYGTYLGATYAAMFPKNVGRMILDGAVNPDDWANHTVEFSGRQITAMEEELKTFFQWCSDRYSNGKCEFGKDKGGPAASFDNLVKQLRAQPLTWEKDGKKGSLSSYELVAHAANGLYGRTAWSGFAKALHAVEQGDASVLGEFIDEGSLGLLNANTVIECNDGTYPRSPAALAKAIDDATKNAPRLGKAVAYGPPATTELSNAGPCSQWKAKANERFAGPFTAAGSNPILVVGTTRDPATPYGDSVALAKQLQNGHLLTMDGDGHTAFKRGAQCIDDASIAYFLDGTVPPAGLSCKQIIND
ncbi:alpha/beta hydrolase [Pseudonocardiaceae bacterium YIM PH 21723]|nr:alpha/beta hydrolase [Pseudonocardiaceae bacterium YIM PH 21723]